MSGVAHDLSPASHRELTEGRKEPLPIVILLLWGPGALLAMQSDPEWKMQETC